MNPKFRAFWRWIATSRHERWLEVEVERLRAEYAEVRRQNWALINSLVSTAGAPLPQEVLRQAGAASARASADTPAGGASRVVNAARVSAGRRSWHQLARALEIESARELRASASRSTGDATTR